MRLDIGDGWYWLNGLNIEYCYIFGGFYGFEALYVEFSGIDCKQKKNTQRNHNNKSMSRISVKRQNETNKYYYTGKVLEDGRKVRTKANGISVSFHESPMNNNKNIFIKAHLEHWKFACQNVECFFRLFSLSFFLVGSVLPEAEFLLFKVGDDFIAAATILKPS